MLTSISGLELTTITDMNVFSSNVPRRINQVQNNLYELIQPTCISVEPIVKSTDNILNPDFQPKTDKLFVRKQKYNKKVKTVRDIRKEYEKYVYSYLLNELENERLTLYNKIQNTSPRNDTVLLAKKILTSGEPISRSTLQMITNINPNNHVHSAQFVLYDGEKIRINGSIGGTNELITDYDIGINNGGINKSISKKITNVLKRKSLLRNSLTINFRPGPRRKKQELDYSYQKYNIGKTEIIKLPSPVLEIIPSYGATLNPIISNYIRDSSLEENGTVSKKWAEFAVSTLGCIKNKQPVLISDERLIFQMNYRNQQKLILMRRGIEPMEDTDFSTTMHKKSKNDNPIIEIEVQTILEKMLDAVEISVKQDSMYLLEKTNPIEQTNFGNSLITEVKEKTKKNFELQRLDVTIIRLPEYESNIPSNNCYNSFCKLGCVCSSIQGGYIPKYHCGHFICMFQCKCDFSKDKINSSFKNTTEELILRSINLNTKLNSKLSKEEEKFQQTVVVTNDKSILLKSRKRTGNLFKKYAEHDMLYKFDDNKKLKPLILNLLQLKYDGVQVWCMVHELYNCFCKGRFLESNVFENLGLRNNNLDKYHEPPENLSNSPENKSPIFKLNNELDYEIRNSSEQLNLDENQLKNKDMFRKDQQLYDTYIVTQSNNKTNVFRYSLTCARTQPYRKRKYSDMYYTARNKKVMAMEINDKNLHKKLIKHYNNSLSNNNDDDEMNIASNENVCNQTAKDIVLPDKSKIISWLETSYVNYKKQLKTGIFKLGAPKDGKISLCPWDVIMARYLERKNYFLMSKEPPNRIYIAVDRNHSFLKNCIDINYIGFADLQQYPDTVQHLVTNKKFDNDNLYILRGMSHCWEVFGSVIKLNKKDNSENKSVSDQQNYVEGSSSGLSLSCDSYDKTELNNEDNNMIQPPSVRNDTDTSKWFVMTIENDFTEMQFYNKGFFVKSVNILTAINVAKSEGKTVRISIQSNPKPRGNTLQFGLYAIPNTKEPCIFIGPYEANEDLGIETINNLNHNKEKKTRGRWLVIKKVDNIKILDDPSYFFPQLEENCDSSLNLNKNIKTLIRENQCKDLLNYTVGNKDHKDNENITVISEANKNILNSVKPIKIRKSNAFYRLKSIIKSPEEISPLLLRKSTVTSNSLFPKVKNMSLLKPSTPQRKMCNAIKTVSNIKPIEGGMSVLNPEEINKRVIENSLTFHKFSNDEICTDINKFVIECQNSVNDIKNTLIISDDETDKSSDLITKIRNVWIESTTVENFGCIQAKINHKNEINFELPGLELSKFQKEEEAFSTLNRYVILNTQCLSTNEYDLPASCIQ